MRGTVAIVLVTMGCGSTMDPATQRAGLMQADRDFAAATARSGVDGWVSYFAPDGRQVPRGQDDVVGHDAIRDLMTPVFAGPGTSITWEPELAAVSEDGTMGYTVGDARTERVAAGDSVDVRHTRYVTVWVRMDGEWKVAVDLGVSR